MAVNAVSADQSRELAPVVGHIGVFPDGDHSGGHHSLQESPSNLDPRDSRLLQVAVRCGRAIIKTVCMEASTSTAAQITRLARDVAASLHLDPSLDGIIELDISDFETNKIEMTYVLGRASSVRHEPAVG